MKAKIRVFLLKALGRADGQPLTEAALVGAVMLMLPEALVTEVRQALKDLEEESFVVGVRDDLTDSVSYGLTLKGTAKAKTL